MWITAFPSWPKPSDIGTKKFEQLPLTTFWKKTVYKTGHVADARIRDSGPFIGAPRLARHDSVKIFLLAGGLEIGFEFRKPAKARFRRRLIVKECLRCPPKPEATFQGLDVNG